MPYKEYEWSGVHVDHDMVHFISQPDHHLIEVKGAITTFNSSIINPRAFK